MQQRTNRIPLIWMYIMIISTVTEIGLTSYYVLFEKWEQGVLNTLMGRNHRFFAHLLYMTSYELPVCILKTLFGLNWKFTIFLECMGQHNTTLTWYSFGWGAVLAITIFRRTNVVKASENKFASITIAISWTVNWNVLKNKEWQTISYQLSLHPSQISEGIL